MNGWARHKILLTCVSDLAQGPDGSKRQQNWSSSGDLITSDSVGAALSPELDPREESARLRLCDRVLICRATLCVRRGGGGGNLESPVLPPPRRARARRDWPCWVADVIFPFFSFLIFFMNAICTNEILLLRMCKNYMYEFLKIICNIFFKNLCLRISFRYHQTYA
jgi:hypothetical protein